MDDSDEQTRNHAIDKVSIVVNTMIIVTCIFYSIFNKLLVLRPLVWEYVFIRFQGMLE